MNVAPISSSIGLILDISGFVLISLTIIKPKKPNGSDVVNLTDAFGELEPLISNIVTLDYLKNDCKAIILKVQSCISVNEIILNNIQTPIIKLYEMYFL